MTRKSTPNLTDPNEAALAATIEEKSQGNTKAKPATKKKSTAKKDATARDPDDPGAKAARAKKKAAAKSGSEAPKKAKYTRTDALHDALAQGGTRAELAEKVDELYVQNGGESKPSGARAMVDLHCPVLIRLGVVVEDENRRLSLAK